MGNLKTPYQLLTVEFSCRYQKIKLVNFNSIGKEKKFVLNKLIFENIISFYSV